MNNHTSKLKDAFDSVHAEDALKESVRASVTRQMSRRCRPVLRGGLRVAGAVACMVLVFFVGYGSRLYFDTVSTISIDINPSIELGINTFDRVISVHAYNEDGSALMQNMDLRFLKCEDALEKIVSSEAVSALLTQEEVLAITVVGEDEAANETLCARLQHHISNNENAQYYSASPQDVDEAHGCGLSYGKYLAYQEALKQDSNLTPEDAQSMTMKEILGISGASCNHEAQSEETEAACDHAVQPEETEAACGSDHGNTEHKGKHHG